MGFSDKRLAKLAVKSVAGGQLHGAFGPVA
jgi:hypothetical protein